ncbi:tryptophan transporter [Aeribacillus pallidus]|jgi:hypothetical protein|uniref:tryptophan transporter n=1 Tax=Aeribacillus pallidus TaxID=33936 RepID=UPI001DD75F5A|nr:tryptophan transporter [Bacillus sp. (in: firmicutes)]
MKTKTLVILSLFVGIGAVLHTIVPGIFLGMKPDMMLTMMFLGILMFPKPNHIFLLGIVTGLISGITSTFPGGFLPNVVDKMLTAFIVYSLFVLIRRMVSPYIGALILTAIGTLISGSIFLSTAALIVGLPGPFVGLFVSVVLPAAVVNTLAMMIIFPIVQSIFKRTHIIEQV